ncbi:MAG: hypothetical protein QOJ81_761, partial [Chloroflexota bacterium]|nr:hypothetical protein [Chloroflexota bacterium]
YLSKTADLASGQLSTAVEVETASTFPTPGKLALEKPLWMKVEDVVVVATDLKGSTKISYSKQDQVGARVYQASSGNCARIFQRFDAQFIDIQGDGLFAIFQGELAAERAMAAAFTLKSFSSRDLARLIDEHLGANAPEGFETGLKIGVDAGTILAKRIGVRGDHNEPVWAGKPVNYATKCAQAADRHEVIITDRFYELIKSNDYAHFSCGCQWGLDESNTPYRLDELAPSSLWGATEVETLGDHSSCKAFPGASSWCELHGDDFCAAIEAGDGDRAELEGLVLPELREDEPEALAA